MPLWKIQKAKHLFEMEQAEYLFLPYRKLWWPDVNLSTRTPLSLSFNQNHLRWNLPKITFLFSI